MFSLSQFFHPNSSHSRLFTHPHIHTLICSVCGLLWRLLSLGMCAESVHVACVGTSLSVWAALRSVGLAPIFSPSAAVDTPLALPCLLWRILLWTRCTRVCYHRVFVSPGYTPGSRVSKLFNFLKNHQAGFHSGCTVEHPQSEIKELQELPVHVLCPVLLYQNHPSDCEVSVKRCLTVVYTCISLTTNVLNMFSCATWPFVLYISLEKCLLKSFVHSVIEWFVFIVFSKGSLHILDTRPLWDVWSTDILPYSVGFTSSVFDGVLWNMTF